MKNKATVFCIASIFKLKSITKYTIRSTPS